MKAIEVVFRFGGTDRRLRATRQSGGALSISIADDYGGRGDGKSMTLEPQETEALCAALNGLGERVPDMEVPRVERKADCIGFHTNGDE